MSWKKYRHIYLWLFLAAFVSFLTFYHYMTILPRDNGDKTLDHALVLPAGRKVIEPETKVYKCEQYSICKKYNLSCRCETLLEGADRVDLANLSEGELQDIYPAAEGWEIIWEKEKVILEQNRSGLCPLHQQRWHLAPDEGGEKIAVYLGPSEVGDEGGIYRDTDIKIEGLAPDLQERIRSGSMEYLTWGEVIATLDSLDE